MKNALITTIFIFLATSIFSQIPKEAVSLEDPEFGNFLKQNKISIVKGKITNFTKEDIPLLKIKYTIVTLFGGKQVEKFAKVDLEGNFELILDYVVPYQQIWLAIGEKFYAGIYAHSELFIEINWQKAKEKEIYMNGEGVKYLGYDGELNTYMNNFVIFEQANQGNTNDELSILKNSNLNYNEFIIKYDSLFKILKKIDSNFINQNKSDLSWIIENERMSDYYGGLCVKHWSKIMNKSLFEKIKNHKSYIVSNSGMLFYRYFYNYLNFDLSIREEENKQLAFLENKLKETPIQDSILVKKNQLLVDNYNAEYVQKNNSGYFYSKFLNIIDGNFAVSKADFMKLQEDENDLRTDNNINKIALKTIKTPWVENLLKFKFQESENKLNEIDKVLSQSNFSSTKGIFGESLGSLPSGAKLFKVETGKAIELLENLKTEFKNKAILIDFWATWCSPCLAELPESKKLYAESAELPIEFVYLCTSSNSTLEKWKTKIVQLQLSGTHIFVEEKIESDLMDLFETNGFPSYRFIDVNGKYKPGANVRGISAENLKLLIEEK